MEKKIGLTIGKFAPLHKGHQYLIETALKEMDQLIIIIYETDCTHIPIERRMQWIQKLYPKAEIRVAKNPPSQYGLDKESVDIQMRYLLNIIPDVQPTHFYSSEPYGKCVAEYMHIIDRRVDAERKQVPISASAIRNHIEDYQHWVEEFVYQDMKEREK